jgi:hypothetical protein
MENSELFTDFSCVGLLVGRAVLIVAMLYETSVVIELSGGRHFLLK